MRRRSTGPLCSGGSRENRSSVSRSVREVIGSESRIFFVLEPGIGGCVAEKGGLEPQRLAAPLGLANRPVPCTGSFSIMVSSQEVPMRRPPPPSLYPWGMFCGQCLRHVFVTRGLAISFLQRAGGNAGCVVRRRRRITDSGKRWTRSTAARPPTCIRSRLSP